MSTDTTNNSVDLDKQIECAKKAAVMAGLWAEIGPIHSGLGHELRVYSDRSMNELVFTFPGKRISNPSPEATEANLKRYRRFEDEFDGLIGRTAQKAQEAADRKAHLDRAEQAVRNLGYKYKRDDIRLVVSLQDHDSTESFRVSWPECADGLIAGGIDTTQLELRIKMVKEFRAEMERLKDPMPEGWSLDGEAFIGPREIRLKTYMAGKADRDAFRQLFDWMDRQGAKTKGA